MNNNPISSLGDIILVISKRLGFIIITIIIFVIATIFYINHNFHPEYTSESKIFIPTENSNSSELHKIVNKFGFGASAYGSLDISSAILYPEIIASKTFAKKLLLKEFYSEKFEQKLPLIAILSYGTDTPSVSIDTLIMKMSGGIISLIDMETPMPFLLLSVTTDQPHLSQDLAEAILQELDKIQREFKSKATIEKRDFIEQQIALAQSDLERLEENLKRFRENNRRIDESPSLMLLQDRIQRDVNIQQGIFLTLKQQLELVKIEEVQKSSFVQVLDPPSFPFKISNPKQMSSYIVGGLAGLFFSLFFVFVFEYFSISDSEESRKLKKAKEIIIKRFKTIKLIKK